MSHLAGVVSGVHYKGLSWSDLPLGVFHRRTSAGSLHILDRDGVGTHVLHFKLRGYRLFVDDITAVDDLILHRELLGVHIKG